MAPMPDDDANFGGGPPGNDSPPHYGITKLPPSMVTSTYTNKLAQTTTVAYFMGSWIDDDGFLHQYTISEFEDVTAAATFAAIIGAMPTAGWGDSGPWQSIWDDYYSGYQSLGTVTDYYQQARPTNTPLSATPQQSQAAPIPSESVQSQKSVKDHDGPPVTALAVGIIVPIIVCILTIIACVCCVSHYRRKARKAQAGDLANRTSSEMRQVPGPTSAPKPPGGVRAVNDERAYLAPMVSSPARAGTGATVAGAGAAGVAAGAISSQQDPPVILSTTMNNGFFTGIDTSDAVSLSDARSIASHDTFGEEPPPPYRPRSVPPISRETSVRTSVISATPNRNSSIRSGHRDTLSSGSIIRRSNEVRSPFDDPEEEDEDDDNLSDVSTIRGSYMGSRETDRLSRVSTDGSYRDASAQPRTDPPR